jgi:hypothetical protein
MSPLSADYVKPRTFVCKDSFVDPVVGDLDAYVDAEAGPNTTTITYQSTKVSLGGTDFDGVIPTGVPDFPRNVVVTVSHGSSVVALSGTITGWRNGARVTEAWSVTAGGTSKTFTGAKAYDMVESITVVAAADASADTVDVGTGNVFGLGQLCSSIGIVEENEDGAAPGTAGTLVAGSTAAAADRLGTYAPNSTPNGSLDFDVWYLSDQPFFHRSGVASA